MIDISQLREITSGCSAINACTNDALVLQEAKEKQELPNFR